MKALTLLFSLLFSVAAFAQDSLPEMNQKILAFAIKKMDKRVGDGKCGELVKAAIIYADRKWEKKIETGQIKVKNQYGRIVDYKEALPGDIIRFKKCVFKDGLKVATSHVVIIENSDYAANGLFDVINQNDNAKSLKESVVTTRHININDIVSGEVTFYRYEK